MGDVCLRLTLMIFGCPPHAVEMPVFCKLNILHKMKHVAHYIWRILVTFSLYLASSMMIALPAVKTFSFRSWTYMFWPNDRNLAVLVLLYTNWGTKFFHPVDNTTIMFILRAYDSFAARILPLSARAKQGPI